MARELTDREKIILTGGGIVAAVIIVVGLIVVPLFKASANYDKALAEKTQVLAKMVELQAALAELKNTDDTGIPQPPKDFTLLAFLENIATRGGIKEKITRLKPSDPEIDDAFEKTEVEIKLTDLDLEQLVNFIYEVEKNQTTAFRTKRLSIKTTFKNEKLLEAVFQVVNIVPVKG